MTLIVGIRCADGVVLAADSAATLGTANGATAQVRTARKLVICRDKLIVGVSGAVGLGQRITAAFDDGYAQNKFKGRAELAVTAMRDSIAPIVTAEMQMGGLVSQATRNQGVLNNALAHTVAALPIEGKPVLVCFAETCSPEILTDGIPFVAIGNGQAMADPFLSFARRLLWPVGLPSLALGRFTAYWALHHVIEANPGGVAGMIQMVELKKSGNNWIASELTEAEIDGHKEACHDLEGYISAWPETRGDSSRAPE